MDIDARLAEFAARLPYGQWSPWNPLTTVEQREAVAMAQDARRELKAERERATRLAAQAQELTLRIDMLERGE